MSDLNDRAFVQHKEFWYKVGATQQGTGPWQGSVIIRRELKDGTPECTELPGEFQSVREAWDAAETFARRRIDELLAGEDGS